MKKHIFILAIVASALPVFGASSIDDKNLSYYWDFDDGTSLQTFYTGNASTASVGFGAYKAFSASGSLTGDGYMTTTATTKLNNTSLYASGLQGINANNFSLSFDLKNYVDGAALIMFNGSKTLSSALGRWGWGAAGETGSYNTALTGTSGTDTWRSIVLSFSNGTMSVYADGSLLGTGNYSNIGAISSFSLGGNAADNTSMRASFDNLAIWNTALDQETAAKLKGKRADEAFNIPEPATATLSLFGLGALLLRRRRRG